MDRNSIKAFTLIELLVVVAIIGILAAVGVVAYNGYTASAKANAVKSNHSAVIKYITSEVMKCNLGSTDIFEGNLKCSDLRSSGQIPRKAAIVLDKIFKNPINSNKNYAIATSGSVNANQNIGDIFVLSSHPSLKIEACFQLECNNSNNIVTSEINVLD